MTCPTLGSPASLAVGLSLVWLGACDGAVHTRGCELDSDCEPGALCVDMRCSGGPTDGGDDPRLDAFAPPPFDAGPPPDGAGSPDGAVECGAIDFVTTETMEMVRVPPGVQYMHIKAWGSGGNGEGACGLPDIEGGPGGYTEAVYAVVPGTEFVVIVGYPGSASVPGGETFRFGWGAHGGGGLTGVFRGPGPIGEADRDRAVVIAGGGGSAGAPGCNPGGPGNYPATEVMPTMMGGFGSDREGLTGGGGGYEGGLGGGRSLAGRGGTGFISPEGLLPDRSRMLHAEPLDNAPPMTDDPDYEAGTGSTEAGGRLVIRYDCIPPPPLI